MKIPGAKPKVIMSAKESNCLPNSLCCFKILAKNPSKKSNIAPKNIGKGAKSILPESERRIAKMPQSMLLAVNKLGILNNLNINQNILFEFLKSIP